ncbi:MAG: hypothetical protein KF789_05460 [Bdellovibrionaceae bacterium]|nr:hypothetical protein [Pseudobdellovibrionaceae bacterium]
MNKKLMILTLIAVALAGTTSYASTPADQEVWDPNVVADASDPGLVFTPQGANTYAMIDPACGPCVAAMKAQLRLSGKNTAYSPNARPTETLGLPEEDGTVLDGQQ